MVSSPVDAHGRTGPALNTDVNANTERAIQLIPTSDERESGDRIQR